MTFGSQSPPLRRAYDERIDGGVGYFLSACLGATHTWFFAELRYALHSAGFEATLEPRVQGVPRVVEERDYVDHALLFSLGAALGFGRRAGSAP